jgi:hypothetical protein
MDVDSMQFSKIRKSQGGARTSHEKQGAARRSQQEQQGGAKGFSHQALLNPVCFVPWSPKKSQKEL